MNEPITLYGMVESDPGPGSRYTEANVRQWLIEDIVAFGLLHGHEVMPDDIRIEWTDSKHVPIGFDALMGTWIPKESES